MSISNIDDNFIQPLTDPPNQYTVPQPQSPLCSSISALSPHPNLHSALNLRALLTSLPIHDRPQSPRSILSQFTPALNLRALSSLNSRPPSISALPSAPIPADFFPSFLPLASHKHLFFPSLNLDKIRHNTLKNYLLHP